MMGWLPIFALNQPTQQEVKVGHCRIVSFPSTPYLQIALAPIAESEKLVQRASNIQYQAGLLFVIKSRVVLVARPGHLKKVTFTAFSTQRSCDGTARQQKPGSGGMFETYLARHLATGMGKLKRLVSMIFEDAHFLLLVKSFWQEAG